MTQYPMIQAQEDFQLDQYLHSKQDRKFTAIETSTGREIEVAYVSGMYSHASQTTDTFTAIKVTRMDGTRYDVKFELVDVNGPFVVYEEGTGIGLCITNFMSERVSGEVVLSSGEYELAAGFNRSHLKLETSEVYTMSRMDSAINLDNIEKKIADLRELKDLLEEYKTIAQLLLQQAISKEEALIDHAVAVEASKPNIYVETFTPANSKAMVGKRGWNAVGGMFTCTGRHEVVDTKNHSSWFVTVVYDIPEPSGNVTGLYAAAVARTFVWVK